MRCCPVHLQLLCDSFVPWLCILNCCLDAPFQCTIKSFNSAVRCRIVHWCTNVFYISLFQKLIEDSRSELGTIIRNNALWVAMTTKDSAQKFDNVLSNRTAGECKFWPLGMIVCECYSISTSRSGCFEWSHDVQTQFFPWALRKLNWLQRCWVYHLIFVIRLVGNACRDCWLDLGVKLRPPVKFA